MMLLYKQDLQYFVRDDLINFQHSPVQEKNNKQMYPTKKCKFTFIAYFKVFQLGL